MGQTSVERLHERLDVLQTSFPPPPSWIQDGDAGNDVIQNLGRVFRPLLRRRRKMAALPLPVAILDDLICGSEMRSSKMATGSGRAAILRRRRNRDRKTRPILLKNSCKGKAVCAGCGEEGHNLDNCKNEPKCVNCQGNHVAISRDCPKWKIEKDIVTLKYTEKISFADARKSLQPSFDPSKDSYATVTQTPPQSSRPLPPWAGVLAGGAGASHNACLHIDSLSFDV